MPKTEWTAMEVYDLLCKIDQGYTPNADEAAMLETRTELNLNLKSITTLPESIGRLTSLQALYLRVTPIIALPESIGQLTSLQTLDLWNTRITALPDSIGQLTNLQELDLSDTQITSLPEPIGRLTSLQELNLNRTPITALPESIGQLKSLQRLNLNGTRITALPKSFGQLSNLQKLDLWNSKITVLPEWIGKLPDLRYLDLAGLTLPEIPQSLSQRGLPFVDDNDFSYDKTGINLHNVTLTKQDISVFLETPELIPSLYENQIPLRECRVLFLGDGGSGKTYTIRRIRNDCKKATAENPYETVQTPGVEIADYHVDRGEDSFDIHFWDFGGQELQHSMHRCFLTDKTCYVVTVRTRETDVTPRARYWLQNVSAFAPTSPILLYVNCWENYNGRKSIDEALLRKEFPNIRKVVYVSAKEAEDETFRKELVEEIADMAAASYGCRQTVNRRWLAVQKDILAESRASHWLTKTRYTELCRKHGIPEDQDAALLELFNILGVCFSYHWDEDRNELEDYKLLNPVWLTNAIYTIIVRGEVHAREGEITVSSIRDLLNRQEAEQTSGGQPARAKRTYGTKECQYVVDVAAAHNLCYRVNEKSLFFPALCSNNTPVQELSNSGDYAQHIEYLLQYTFLPDSVVHQLMVRCRKADITVNHCWLKGMVLGCMDAHKAIIRMEDDKNLRIEIWSKAEHPAYEFFELIRRELLAVNKNLNLRAKEFIVEGRSQLPVEDLLPAARDKAYVYCGGKKVLAEKLLGQFYENWTIQFMRVEENGYIKVPILPSKFHACSKDNQNLRKALYKAYNGYCQYCGKPIPDIHDMQVDHILPKKYVDQPELTDYVSYLKQRGFAVEKPDFVENYLPAHGKCNRDKSDFVSPFALLAWHDLAARRAPTVLRLIEEYKKANKG